MVPKKRKYITHRSIRLQWESRGFLPGQGLFPHLKLAMSIPEDSILSKWPQSNHGRILRGVPCLGEILMWSLTKKAKKFHSFLSLVKGQGRWSKLAFSQRCPVLKTGFPPLTLRTCVPAHPTVLTNLLLSN